MGKSKRTRGRQGGGAGTRRRTRSNPHAALLIGGDRGHVAAEHLFRLAQRQALLRRPHPAAVCQAAVSSVGRGGGEGGRSRQASNTSMGGSSSDAALSPHPGAPSAAHRCTRIRAAMALPLPVLRSPIPPTHLTPQPPAHFMAPLRCPVQMRPKGSRCRQVTAESPRASCTSAVTSVARSYTNRELPNMFLRTDGGQVAERWTGGGWG